jgi:hypothetical protein
LREVEELLISIFNSKAGDFGGRVVKLQVRIGSIGKSF